MLGSNEDIHPRAHHFAGHYSQPLPLPHVPIGCSSSADNGVTAIAAPDAMLDFLGTHESFTVFAPSDLSLHQLSGIFRKPEEKEQQVRRTRKNVKR